MNINQYVNRIVREIQCDRIRKKEIRKQLQMEIEARIQQGDKPEDIMEQMGSVKEIAAGFNENLSEQEKKRYGRRKILWIVVLVVLGILLAAGLVGWGLYLQLPRTIEIEDSKYFETEQVEDAMRKIIDAWDEEDYEAIRAMSTSRMAPLLNKEEMDKNKVLLAEDWGSRKNMGKIYLVEIVQQNKHYAVGEVQVVYENVKTIYRLTFDDQMQLCGIYFR